MQEANVPTQRVNQAVGSFDLDAGLGYSPIAREDAKLDPEYTEPVPINGWRLIHLVARYVAEMRITTGVIASSMCEKRIKAGIVPFSQLLDSN